MPPVVGRPAARVGRPWMWVRLARRVARSKRALRVSSLQPPHPPAPSGGEPPQRRRPAWRLRQERSRAIESSRAQLAAAGSRHWRPRLTEQRRLSLKPARRRPCSLPASWQMPVSRRFPSYAARPPSISAASVAMVPPSSPSLSCARTSARRRPLTLRMSSERVGRLGAVES